MTHDFIVRRHVEEMNMPCTINECSECRIFPRRPPTEISSKTVGIFIFLLFIYYCGIHLSKYYGQGHK